MSETVDGHVKRYGILDAERADERDRVIELLTTAYWMEIETVVNYLGASINLDGLRAREVVEALHEDVEEELTHAREFGGRIKELYGVVPGSLGFAASQQSLQPPTEQTDVEHVVRGVIDAERGAIAHYEQIVEETADVDLVTQDMVIGILRQEQAHLRLFEGFLRELAPDGTRARSAAGVD